VSSRAFAIHLRQLLKDADALRAAHSQLSTTTAGRPPAGAAINRAIVVACVSAWESYLEELIRECVEVLRPPEPPMGAWPSLKAYVFGLLTRFHSPNSANVKNLIDQVLSLPNIHHFWTWPRCSSAQAVVRLEAVMKFRHEIAHGINPRPTVHNSYASLLPGLILKLADCTDKAVRHHLIHTYHLSDPWPG